MRLTLRPRAEIDLAEAHAWYEARQRNLGDRFLDAVGECFMRLEREPEIFPMKVGRVRQAPVRRYPYSIFYVIRESRVDVISVQHTRRRAR